MSLFFTVAIPTHKRKTQLSNLLSTLEQQSLDKKMFEVIVVASENDPALSLPIDHYSFPLQILTIQNDPFKGKSASAKRNFAVAKAMGEWIAFTDDDCLADKDWLKNAKQQALEQDVHFMEGYVHIPEPNIKTLTYKGMQRLSKPKGYQTCNMFYKKKDFLQLKGFDPNFPFYLEDTDLAWTFIENKKDYLYAENAKISHPVPPAQTSKMLEGAIRMEKIPYLYKKHPETFKHSQMRVYSRPYLILLVLDFLLIFSSVFFPMYFIPFLILRLLATKILLIRMMRDCVMSVQETFQIYYYLMICPLISFIFLIKGNLQNRVWIFFK